jgi:hypothetical protein
MLVKKQRSSAEKIAIFSKRFTARTDVYGTYDLKTGKTYQKKETVTKNVLLNHLLGRTPYGMYILIKDRASVAVIDFDDHDRNGPVEFIQQAKHYNISAYLEVSKSKGWHVWIFCEKAGVSAIKLRTIACQILEDISCPSIEVFPKQNCIMNEKYEYGNFINCPLFGKLVPQGRTIFVDPDNSFLPYDQWSFLKSVKLLTEKELDDLIEINDWTLINTHKKKTSQNISNITKTKYKFHTLRPCAQEMLKGVSENQRVICFRLAISLCTAGFDKPMSQDILFSWAARNTPKNGKAIITKKEIIEQCSYGFNSNQTSYGCGEAATNPYCNQDCHLYEINIKKTGN